MFKLTTNSKGMPVKADILGSKAGFRYFEMEKGDVYELNEKKSIHFIFLLEGEIMLGGLKNYKPILRKDEFLFIPDTKTVLMATTESKFVLFSINEYYCRIDPIYSQYISSILSGLHSHLMPLTPPRSLSVFFKEIIALWGERLEDPIIQEIKRKEFIVILDYLYGKNNESNSEYSNGWQYGDLSLS